MSENRERSVRHVAVAVDDGDVRLDRWFKRHFPDVRYGELAKWLRTGQVRVDGKRAKPGQRLVAGQEVRIPPRAPDEIDGEAPRRTVPKEDAEALRERVVYRDDWLIALNKPSGLAVQGGSRTTRHLDGMLDALRFDAAERPRLVHRLDKDTSGLLVLACSRRSARELAQLFRGREVTKTYWAIVRGVPEPEAGVIDLPLSKQGRPGAERMAKDDVGQEAETAYRIVDHAARRFSWLELRPHTGRTHQLRAHCAAIGNPIVGDRKYGGRENMVAGLAERLHLHASGLSLPHPGTNVRLDLAAPLEPELRASWESLGFDPETP
jgi:23S rRNA pseudouridine955/2504/2580 synthase